MGLFYKLDRILDTLEEMQQGQEALRNAVDELLERPVGRDRVQEGIENILRYTGPGEREEGTL